MSPPPRFVYARNDYTTRPVLVYPDDVGRRGGSDDRLNYHDDDHDNTSNMMDWGIRRKENYCIASTRRRLLRVLPFCRHVYIIHIILYRVIYLNGITLIFLSRFLYFLKKIYVFHNTKYLSLHCYHHKTLNFQFFFILIRSNICLTYKFRIYRVLLINI